jgi:hypothetical protein
MGGRQAWWVCFLKNNGNLPAAVDEARVMASSLPRSPVLTAVASDVARVFISFFLRMRDYGAGKRVDAGPIGNSLMDLS